MSANATGREPRVLATLNADGSRRWLRPKLSPGRWLTRRRVVGYALIVFFVALPHVTIAGRPAVLLDIVNREFTFFGTTLYPTDTLLLALLLLSVFVGVFLLTALFGRVWCGWACPQTVYMELVFRPVERFFEGAPGRKPKAGGWRKPAKHAVFVLLALFLAHTFLSYFVGVDALRTWMLSPPWEHPLSFGVVAVVTGLMLFDFGFFREQLCLVACPYGRMQSVMLDRDSLIVAYDNKRGEPRGRKRRTAPSGVSLRVVPDEPAGDCIDCTMCVQTCPTGIDIRDGLQLECVQCAQCIDACDAVMDKIGKPRGLIRYASQRSIEEGRRKLVRPRVVVYPAILCVVLTAFVTVLASRADAFVSVLRGPGLPYYVDDSGRVVTSLRVKVHDRTREGDTYDVSLEGVPGATLAGEAFPMRLGPGEIASQSVTISAPPASFDGGSADATLVVRGEAGFERRVRYRLLGPRASDSGEGGSP